MANWDITFCSNKECKNINCPKNLKSDNAKSFPPYRSMYVADFTDKCKRGEKMRLIDADALIERIDTEIRNAIEREDIYDYMEDERNSLIAWLQTQPTAYDVDMVVEELEQEQEKWLRGYNQTLAMGMEHLWRNLSGRAYGVTSAIDIVKRGGIND